MLDGPVFFEQLTCFLTLFPVYFRLFSDAKKEIDSRPTSNFIITPATNSETVLNFLFLH